MAACVKAGAGVIVDINAVNRSIAASILCILSNIHSSMCVWCMCIIIELIST